MENIQITSDGIKKNLKRIKPYNAICEYIWNGFDAGATQIEIIFEFNQIENVSSITIIDNGNGINYDELSLKFKPFNDSEKATDNNNSHHSIPHGKHGIGRFTFFTFASNAQWYTVYKDENAVNKAYSIRYMTENHGLAITKTMKRERWLMPRIRSGCKLDYGMGRLFFAGEVAGFLNPMGEGISAGMESGHSVALSVIEHFNVPASVLDDYKKRTEMLKVYMQRQWHFVSGMSETFGEMRAAL